MNTLAEMKESNNDLGVKFSPQNSSISIDHNSLSNKNIFTFPEIREDLNNSSGLLSINVRII